VLNARLRAAALCAVLLPVAAASRAQTSGSIVMTSDYRYRGVSLSGERPALRLTAAQDTPDGWYVGASLASVVFDPPQRQWQTLVYGGRATRLSESLGAEGGVLRVHFTAGSRSDYHEWFAGLSGERWSARLYLAPSYFGSGVRTAYAELNAGMPLRPHVMLSAHLGALARIGGAIDGERTHLDARAGIGWLHSHWQVQLDGVTGSRAGIYPVRYGREGAAVLSATYAF